MFCFAAINIKRCPGKRPGFVQFMENLESHEIYECHFPVLESHGRLNLCLVDKSWKLSTQEKLWHRQVIKQCKRHALWFMPDSPFFEVGMPNNPFKNKDSFETFRKRQLNLRSWKTSEGHRKSHGKSWNLKSSKEYEPCRRDFCEMSPLSSPLLAVLLICSTFPCNRQRPGSITIQIIPNLTRNSMYSLRWVC